MSPPGARDPRESPHWTAAMAALTLAAATFVMATRCESFAPAPHRAPASAATGSKTPPADSLDAGVDAADAAGEPAAAPSAGSPIEGFALSKSGRQLATWSGCECPSGDNPFPEACRVALWDVPKRRITASFEPHCIHGEASVSWTPAEDRILVSSRGLGRMFRTVDGAFLYDIGHVDCPGSASLAIDGTKIYWVNACASVGMFRERDGARIGGAEVSTQDENAVAPPTLSWDERNDILAICTDGREITLAPLRGGRPRRVSLPPIPGTSLAVVDWIFGTSSFLVDRPDGLLAILDGADGTLRILEQPDPALHDTPLSRISENGEDLVRWSPSGRVTRWNLRRRSLRDIGITRQEWPSAFEPSPAWDFVAVGHARSIELLPMREGSPDWPFEISLSLRDEQSYPAFVGWTDDGTYVVTDDRGLLSIGPGGRTRLVRTLQKGFSSIRMVPSRRAVIVQGAELLWVRLEDGRAATLVQAGRGSDIHGHIEGVQSDADWTGMGAASAPAPR
jgi:hypothetical protein